MSAERDTLVIGGAGYIGSWLTTQLAATGRAVTVLDQRPAPADLPAGVDYVRGDYSEAVLIGRLLDGHGDVIDLAYATVPNTSFEDPLADLVANVPPAVQLFQEAARRGRRVLFISSGGTVYGMTDSHRIVETEATEPISPYGVTKLTIEHYAHMFAAVRGLAYICVRPANAYGVGQRPFAGQGFIATAIAAALQGQPIRIFGREGTIRDYLYVSDLAAGIVAALEADEAPQTYNLGSGVGRSNLDVVNAIRPLLAECGAAVTVEHLPERVFDVRANVLDSTKLRDHTGWAPRIDFTDGLRRTRDWLREHYG